MVVVVFISFQLQLQDFEFCGGFSIMSLQALIVAQALVPSNPSICCSVVNSEHSSATRRPCQQLPQASLRNASLRAANVEQVSTLFSGGGDKNNNGRVGGGGDGGGGGGSSGGSGGSHGGFEDQSGVPLVHVTAWSLLWARSDFPFPPKTAEWVWLLAGSFGVAFCSCRGMVVLRGVK